MEWLNLDHLPEWRYCCCDTWSAGTLFKLLNSAVLCCGFIPSLVVCLLSVFMSLHPAVTAQGMMKRRMPVFREYGIVFLCGAPGMDVDVERGYGDTFLHTGDRTLRCHFPWWGTGQPSHTAVRFVLVYDGFSVGELSKLQGCSKKKTLFRGKYVFKSVTYIYYNVLQNTSFWLVSCGVFLYNISL